MKKLIYKLRSLAVSGLLLARQSDFEEVPGSGNTLRLPKFFQGATGPAGTASLGQLVTDVIRILLFVVGMIAVIFIIIGGYRYIMAHGNEEQAESAKKTIYHAIIGLAIVILSFIMVTIISKVLITGDIFS